MAKESRQRMISHLRTLARELPSEGAGPHVALRANLERDFTLGEKVHQRWIFNGCEAMADALDSEQVNGFADFLRAADFAGMNQAMQANFGGVIVHGAEFRGRHLELIATDAEGDDGFGLTSFRSFHHGHRGVGPELPNCVKDPSKAQAAALERFGG